jgi:hypothetical protein
MILTDENRSSRRKSYLSVTLSTTNLTSADLGSKPGLPAERQAINRLSHGIAVKTRRQLISTSRRIDERRCGLDDDANGCSVKFMLTTLGLKEGSVSTSQRTQPVCITKSRSVDVDREAITVL